MMKRHVTVDLMAVGAVVAGLVIAAAVLPMLPASPNERVTLRQLEKRFGPKRYSELNEELVIRDFFRDRQYGVFVDVGAGHYLQGSNTYFLEHDQQWRGIAVDAIADYGDDYARYRPQTRFFALFVSDKSDQDVDFFMAVHNRTQSSGIENATGNAGTVVRQRVRTVTMDDLLGAASITRFDFLSMDIELGEPAALAGFNIQRFHPALVCIEAHEPVRADIARYFEANGYQRLDKYLDVDPRNWYFTPR